ncbi:MAG: hypothetical protein V3W14_03715, partial [Candidatus Neomarinimicrobiota bacterium]
MSNTVKTIRLILGTSIVIAVGAMLFFPFEHDDRKPSSGITEHERFQQILSRYNELAIPLGEKRKLARQIHKMKKRMGKRTAAAENPSDFYEALALIKTNTKGKTYPSGYKIAESERARARKSLAKGSSASEFNWTSRGPNNVSGRARGVAVDSSGIVWWVATVGGGVWKTENEGATWELKTPTFSSLSTTCIAIAKSNPAVMYVGTGMGYGRILDLSGSGIWKSTDTGENWDQLESTANGQLLQAINRIVVDPFNENILLVCSNDTESYNSPKTGVRRSAIFRSTDGGLSWVPVYDPDITLGTATDNRIQQILPNPSNFDILYASVNEVGVLKSTDKGLNWRVVADDFAQPDYIGTGGDDYRGISTRIELAISPSDTTRLYAAVERHRQAADLFMSTDAGETWQLVEDTGSDPDWFNWSGDPSGYQAGWFDNTILVHPFDPDIVFVGGINMYRINVDPELHRRTTTMIAGAYSSNSVIHVDQHYLTAIIDNRATHSFRLLCANDGGLAYSPDGGITWQQISGMISTQFYGVDKKPGAEAYIGGMQDNGTRFSTPGVTDWNWATGGDGVEVVWNADNPDLMLSGTQYGNFARSNDGGLTWSFFEGPPLGWFPFITKYGHTKADPYRIYTIGSEGVARSDFFGQDWYHTRLTTNWHGHRAFDNIEVSPADPEVVWITSRMAYDELVSRNGGIQVSVDGAYNFTDITANLPVSVVEASGLATDPHDRNTAYLLFAAPDSPKILKTDDLGQTFVDLTGFGPGATESSNGFPDVAVFDLVVMPYNTDILWAGTEIGLFVSQDGGLSWAYQASEMGHVSIFQMKVVDNQVVVGTYGRGVWTAEPPELATYTASPVTLMPGLSEPYLNPANEMVLNIDLRSLYDEVIVKLDDAVLTTMPANDATGQQVFKTTVYTLTAGWIVVEAVKDGEHYLSNSYLVNFEPAVPIQYYSSNFADPETENDFVGDGFSISQPSGFSDPAIHSQHPYPPGTSLIWRLKSPVEVAQSDALIEFDEIVLVEIGFTAVWPNNTFFDYVIVEGSSDGINWIPLVDGYDSGANQAWRNAYDSGQSGTPSLYRQRTIDIHPHFQAGTNVFIRFRLFADPGIEGWGWAIDNLQIQSGSSSITGKNGAPDQFHLSQNYPNPFNPV